MTTTARHLPTQWALTLFAFALFYAYVAGMAFAQFMIYGTMDLS